MGIQKANRIELLDEGVSQGWARSLNIVGPSLVASVSADTGLITYSGREVLTANRTYYVRTDGSDSNTGLANTAGGAFATIAKAFSVIGGLDLSTFVVTVQLGNTGNYAGTTVAGRWVGGAGSLVVLVGDAAAPGSYVITSTLTVSDSCLLFVSGVKFLPSTGDGLSVASYASVTIFGACQCGAAAGARQIVAASTANIGIGAVLTINGGAANWILAVGNSTVTSNGFAHVFSGTPAFSTATVQAQTGAIVTVVNASLSGAATGKRYDATLNSVIYTNGGGINYFPGNVAGTTGTGGQYA